MEYHQPGQTQQRHSGSVYHSVDNRNPWRTGYITRLPVAGLLAVLGSLIGIAACAGILAASDGQPITHWKFQPTVYLAIASTITNIFLAFALSEGADIAWWRKASSENTTVADLHRVWNHGRSFKEAMMAGRHMTMVAAACLLASIAQINSPLLQRASTVAIETVTTNVQVSVRAISTPPTAGTGYTSGRGVTPSLFTSKYTEVVKTWNSNNSIPLNGTGCEGLCSTKMRSLGLKVSCSSSKIPFSLTPKLTGTNNGSLDVTDQSVQGVNVFQSTWVFGTNTDGNMTLRATYKGTSDCKGDLTVEECDVRIANMEYRVVIDGNKSTISLDPTSNIYDDKLVSYLTTNLENIQGLSTLGGFYLALQNKYYSNATLRFTGAVGPYTLITTGNTVLQYVVSSDKAVNNCTTYFRSPIEDILRSARDLMFRTGIDAADSNTPVQLVSGVDSSPRAVYRSNYYYLGGAIGITVIAIIAVLSIYRGYAELGRDPSMSPIEVAKAFNAPILQSHDSNAEAEDLIRDVGKRSVRYGAVPEGPGGFNAPPVNSLGVPTEYKPYNPYVQEVNSNARRRLVIAEQTYVQKPAAGETFAG